MRSILKRTAASRPCQLLDDVAPPIRKELLEKAMTPPWLQKKEITEAGKLRRALEEVAHLTTRNVLEGEPWGWEQVTVQRIAAIERVVKTALQDNEAEEN